MPKSQPSGELPDKDYLYGKYQESRDWRERLARQAAHKALDIGDTEDMNITNNIRRGLDWKGLAVVAATLVFGGGYVLPNVLSALPGQPPVVTQPPTDPPSAKQPGPDHRDTNTNHAFFPVQRRPGNK